MIVPSQTMFKASKKSVKKLGHWYPQNILLIIKLLLTLTPPKGLHFFKTVMMDS